MSSARNEHDERKTAAGSVHAGRYEIRLRGHLDARWAAWFDGLRLTHEADGTTSLTGPMIDQAALHGLLQKVRDLGVPLISITQIDPDQPDASSPAMSGDPPRRPT